MILSIQYMRAIAALMIVVHHTAWKGFTYSTDPLGWFHVGRAGVDLFFIISGYIMCHTVHNRPIQIIPFIKARIRRIIPVYWVLTLLALIIYIVMPDKVNSSGGTTDIVNSFTLWPTDGKYLINNGWTLSYEFFFYALFATSLVFASRYRYLIPAGIILVLVAIGMSLDNPEPLPLLATNPLLLEFVFGITIFYWREKIFETAYLAWPLIVISILVLIIVNNGYWWHSRVICYGLPAALFFIGFLSLEPLFQQHKESTLSKLTHAIGDSSYSLYLIHPFSLVFGAIVLRALNLNQVGSLFSLCLILGSVIAGYLCFILIEKNLARLLKPTPSKI